MIKLKDLKKGDIVYLTHKYYWIQKLEITREVHEFEYQSKDAATIYCANGKIVSDSPLHDGSNQTLFQLEEKSLFRTLEEAKSEIESQKKKKLDELAKDGNLVKELYKMAYNGMADADRELYREAIEKWIY